jgi:phosphoribosylamine--glycine ligase
VFGPSRLGARLESSKAFAKEIMARAGVPTARAWVFENRTAALAHIAAQAGPYVVKADGLAAGKGVLVTDDAGAAAAWVEDCFSGTFGAAGQRVVIEEWLDGPEVSIFAICDGARAVPLEPARDYKRLGDGDAGPNTGGMGSYSPVDDLPERLVEWTMDAVVAPVLGAMAADGDPYIGFLYVGLMLTSDGPKVLEFNCRLGDPETQVVLPRLEDDLVALLSAAADGELPPWPLRWSRNAAVNVVLAAHGYPTMPRRGDTISGLDSVSPASLVFHAGTAVVDGNIVTAGGRVLNVVGIAEDLAGARSLAYEAAGAIEFAGEHHRTDIAQLNTAGVT